jgi:hypothetical protein
MDYGTYLKDLLSRGRRLNSSAFSLSAMPAAEAGRLSRWDEASRLKELYISIRRQLDQVRISENAASCGYSRAELRFSVGTLALGGIIKLLSSNRGLSAFADRLLESPVNKERPFGLVLICIGPGGLPEDVQVIPVSRLARESDCEESEVVHVLRQHGYLLITEAAFLVLILRLVADVKEGRLRLPISQAQLSEITASGQLRLEAKKVE